MYKKHGYGKDLGRTRKDIIIFEEIKTELDETLIKGITMEAEKSTPNIIWAYNWTTCEELERSCKKL